MQLVKVQSIVLIVVAFIYTILAHVSKRNPGWDETLEKNIDIKHTKNSLKSVLNSLENVESKIETLNNKIDALDTENAANAAALAAANVLNGGGGDANAAANVLNGGGGDANAAANVLNGGNGAANAAALAPNGGGNAAALARFEDTTTSRDSLVNEKKELLIKQVDLETRETKLQAKLDELIPDGQRNGIDKTSASTDNANSAINSNIEALIPDGGQMQEKSVVLVIIAVLVLLLNMNGLLRSSEVGDPLQVVVGIMLVVFGINVLVKFNKNDKLQIGTIKVFKLYKVQDKDELDDKGKKQMRKTKAAAVLGTIGGILCAILGVQVLVGSFIKQKPNFKSLKGLSLKSLKRKKKK